VLAVMRIHAPAVLETKLVSQTIDVSSLATMNGGQTDLLAGVKKESSQGNLVQTRSRSGWMKFAMFQARIQISSNQGNGAVKENQFGM